MFYCIGIYNKHCLSLQKLKNDNTQHTHPLKFFNLVIVHTLDFWYMIKNKEATDSAALEFCHVFLRIRSRLGALSEPQRVSVLNTLEGEFRKESRRISDL